jgi:hypothetical protein
MQTSPDLVGGALKDTEYPAEKRDLVKHAKCTVQVKMCWMISKIFQTKCTPALQM